jgi:hypothetical protein
MKRLLLFALLSLFLAVVTAEAAEKSVYQTGKLVDMSSAESGAGAGRGQRIFCIAVETGNLSYTLHYWPNWRGSYVPTDLVVGDPVEIMVDKNHLYIKKTSGGDLKTDIVRRERKSPDKKPPTCALPVSTQN